MQPNGPLDASQIDFSQFGDDDDVELVITEEHGTPSESSPKVEFPYKRNEKFVSLTDHDLDEEIRKHQGYLRTLPLKDTAKLKKKIADFENEKLSRQRKNRSKEQEKLKQAAKPPSKGFPVNGGRSRSGGSLNTKRLCDVLAETDRSGRLSKTEETNGAAFSDEIQIINPPKEKGPFTQRSPNTERCAFDGFKDSLRIFSAPLSGSRLGLRSSSKLCSQCNGRTNSDFICGTCRFHAKESKRSSFSSTRESPKRNSSPGPTLRRKGNGVNKRARQGVGDGDSPEKIVELMSSEDEEVQEAQNTFADCQIALQKRGYGTRSSLLPSMEGVRIAYPSGSDPEAVEVLYHDLHRLEPLEFLNDTVIDFYIKYIQRTENLSVEEKHRFHFFNSFFYKKLSEIVGGQVPAYESSCLQDAQSAIREVKAAKLITRDKFLLLISNEETPGRAQILTDFLWMDQNKKATADLSKLRKWTKRTNIFEKEYLFVPIHDKWHWSLAIVCHPGAASEDTGSQRCILHLDSMSPGHKSNSVFRLLRTYLIAEWRHQAVDDEWLEVAVEEIRPEDFVVKKIPVPQQENESDCGLFLLHYIEEFIKVAPRSFTLCDVDDGRLFGLHWFEPQQASSLRSKVKELLETLFMEAEASRATENAAETIERSSWQRDEDGSGEQNDPQQANCSAVALDCETSPGQPSAPELLHEQQCTTPSAPCVPNTESPSRVSTPQALEAECAQPHFGHGVGRLDEDTGACSPRNSNEPPAAPMSGLSGEFEAAAGSKPSGGSADDVKATKRLSQAKRRTSDVGGGNQCGIPLVVDLTVQEEEEELSGA